jgi:iron(III) transport system substrate-binding protein
MIAANGSAGAEKWLTGLKDNLVARPNGTDRSQVEAIAAGKCDLALGNSAVLAAMLTGTDAEDKKAAEAVQMIYPAGRGAYGNISGMAMAKFAPNKINARALMTFLATRPAQTVYSQAALEFPVVAKVRPEAGAWYGSRLPIPDAVPMSEVLKHRDEAVALVDKTGFNEGPAQ